VIVCASFVRLVAKACQKLVQAQAAGSPQHEAWNKSSIYLVKAAEVSSGYIVDVMLDLDKLLFRTKRRSDCITRMRNTLKNLMFPIYRYEAEK
jgi:Acyl-CoA oxidase